MKMKNIKIEKSDQKIVFNNECEVYNYLEAHVFVSLWLGIEWMRISVK